jgi:hypothetical protein
MIIAKIKKIDITNKVAAENWSQTITITLSDIELNDENLIAIRKFRPNEEVTVHVQSLQLSMEEVAERQKLKELYPTHGEICPINHVVQDEDIAEVTFDEDDDNLFDLDYEEIIPNTDKVLMTFDFSKM